MEFKNIGYKIKQLRAAKNLTQKELAELASLSDKYISNIENGVDSCSLAALITLANIFESSIDYLLDEELLYNQIANANKSKCMVDIIHALNTLSEKQQKFILAMIVQMKDTGLA